MGGRLGMLGGTFDPVHVGHLVVAQDAFEALELDRMLVIPAGRPPHRRAALPAELRLRLTRRAFRGDPRMEVSDLEIRRSGPSYTVDTLATIREEHDPDELYCVVGVDQLLSLDGWHRPERIPELAELVVMSRGGERPDPEELPTDVPFRWLPVTRVDLSSSRIRRRLSEGLTVRYLVPESIWRDVEEAWEERASPGEEEEAARAWNESEEGVY